MVHCVAKKGPLSNTPFLSGKDAARGVSYLLCPLIKNPEEEDPKKKNPPRSTWYKFFEGGPFPPGSWLGGT